jgi:hypothetical protein
LRRGQGKARSGGVVDLLVELAAAEVLDAVFDGCYGEDEGEGEDGEGAGGGAEDGEYWKGNGLDWDEMRFNLGEGRERGNE